MRFSILNVRLCNTLNRWLSIELLGRLSILIDNLDGLKEPSQFNWFKYLVLSFGVGGGGLLSTKILY